MKKIAVICSFLLITVFSTGAFLIHLYYLKSYKKEFKLFLKQSKNLNAQDTIFINPCELYENTAQMIWEDKNKEVIFKGTLYDIIEVKNVGKKVAIVVVSDAQEMVLKKEFAELFDSNSHESTNKPCHLLKNLFSFKGVVTTVVFNFQSGTNCLSTLNSPLSFSILPVFLSMESPPPDWFC